MENGIRKSDLSDDLKDSVLGCIDFNSFYGLGIIIISIPPQKSISYVGEDVYIRVSDSTELITSARQVASVTQRFSS